MNIEIKEDIINKFKGINENEKIELLGFLLKQLKAAESNQLPIGIFSGKLSSLEAIVKYLKENLNLRFSKIAELLNRNNKSLWSTYNNAKKKMPLYFSDIKSDIMVPAPIFADRELSVLENLVNFLKNMDLSNHEIALLLNLNDRTIWSVYHKVKLKRGIK